MSPEKPFFVIHQGGQRPWGRCSPGRIDRRCIGPPRAPPRVLAVVLAVAAHTRDTGRRGWRLRRQTRLVRRFGHLRHPLRNLGAGQRRDSRSVGAEQPVAGGGQRPGSHISTPPPESQRRCPGRACVRHHGTWRGASWRAPSRASRSSFARAARSHP